MRFTLTLCLTAILGSLSAQRAPIEFEEYDLKNGLHVILHEDHSAPIVAVSVMYHVGSKNEDPNRTGMAHFFEHLLFEGSDNIGRGEFFKYIQNAGGQNNANTSNDRTFYYEVLPSNQLELGLWLESERMMHARQKNFLATRAKLAEHSVEKVGAELRAMMPCIGKKKLVDSDKS